MNSVSTPYEAGGRTEQKKRARQKLITAAQQLVAEGTAPTVEEAAIRAGISRSTAYRYFQSQHSLLAVAHPETRAESLLTAEPPSDPAERLAEVIQAFTDLVLRTELQQRTMLRLSLDADVAERRALPLRQGRAIGWIAEALEPLTVQLPEPVVHQLVLAIRSATGIEALAWLTDVAGLSRKDAVQVMSWSAQAMLHAAVTWMPPPVAVATDGTAVVTSV